MDIPALVIYVGHDRRALPVGKVTEIIGRCQWTLAESNGETLFPQCRFLFGKAFK